MFYFCQMWFPHKAEQHNIHTDNYAGTLKNIHLLWAKYIPSVQTDLILLESRGSDSSVTGYKRQVALNGVCTERHGCTFLFVIIKLWNIYDCTFNKDNRMLGKPQELQRRRIVWIILPSGAFRAEPFPAIHTCLDTERQGHLNLTVTVWPKHQGAPQLERYIRRWKRKAFFCLFFFCHYCTIKGRLVCRRQLSLLSTCKTLVVCHTCV